MLDRFPFREGVNPDVIPRKTSYVKLFAVFLSISRRKGVGTFSRPLRVNSGRVISPQHRFRTMRLVGGRPGKELLMIGRYEVGPTSDHFLTTRIG